MCLRKSLNSLKLILFCMKRLNVFISEEAHEIIVAYQKKMGHKTRDDAANAFILEKGSK